MSVTRYAKNAVAMDHMNEQNSKDQWFNPIIL